jgi:uncharacterized protein with von Willebrand factor type A (vWA) domain
MAYPVINTVPMGMMTISLGQGIHEFELSQRSMRLVLKDAGTKDRKGRVSKSAQRMMNVKRPNGRPMPSLKL